MNHISSPDTSDSAIEREIQAKGKTDSRGLLLCEPKESEPGSVYLLAEARDAQGNIARSSTSYWVSGGGL